MRERESTRPAIDLSSVNTEKSLNKTVHISEQSAMLCRSLTVSLIPFKKEKRKKKNRHWINKCALPGINSNGTHWAFWSISAAATTG